MPLRAARACDTPLRDQAVLLLYRRCVSKSASVCMPLRAARACDTPLRDQAVLMLPQVCEQKCLGVHVCSRVVHGCEMLLCVLLTVLVLLEVCEQDACERAMMLAGTATHTRSGLDVWRYTGTHPHCTPAAPLLPPNCTQVDSRHLAQRRSHAKINRQPAAAL